MKRILVITEMLKELIQKANKEDVIDFLNNNDSVFTYDDNSLDAIEYLKTSTLFDVFLIESNILKLGNDKLNFIECLYSLDVITPKKLADMIEDSIICDYDEFDLLIWNKEHVVKTLLEAYMIKKCDCE